jgi:hypothetical protein
MRKTTRPTSKTLVRSQFSFSSRGIFFLCYLLLRIACACSTHFSCLLCTGAGGGENAQVEDYDPDITCAACQEIGHSYPNCPLLEEYLADPRDWHELAPSELLFPRWEIPMMSYMVAGIASSTGAVIGAAGMLYVIWNSILHQLNLVLRRKI